MASPFHRTPRSIKSDGFGRSSVAVAAAVDLIHTPDGRHVFLEVNPGGQYQWLEHHLGLPISEAIAELLVDPAARRVPGRIEPLS